MAALANMLGDCEDRLALKMQQAAPYLFYVTEDFTARAPSDITIRTGGVTSGYFGRTRKRTRHHSNRSRTEVFETQALKGSMSELIHAFLSLDPGRPGQVGRQMNSRKATIFPF
jgi:hypothetical protein